MGCELIPDGYTRSDDCHGLKVVFRPMPFCDYDDYQTAVAAAPQEQQRALINKLVCDRVESWQATRDGEVVPITAENFDRLPAAAGQRLRYLITGQIPADDGSTQGGDSKN